MDKETLSNYGWIVICVLVLAVMLALASPFGNFVADAIKSTTKGLFDVSQKAGAIAGLDIADQNFEGSGGGSTSQATTPLRFGEKYICTTDNAGQGVVGAYSIFYEDGSSFESVAPDAPLPTGYWTYCGAEITHEGQSSKNQFFVSEDGTTITFTSAGIVALIWTLESAVS